RLPDRARARLRRARSGRGTGSAPVGSPRSSRENGSTRRLGRSFYRNFLPAALGSFRVDRSDVLLLAELELQATRTIGELERTDIRAASEVRVVKLAGHGPPRWGDADAQPCRDHIAGCNRASHDAKVALSGRFEFEFG